MAFLDEMLAYSSLKHYYPLSDVNGADDLKGTQHGTAQAGVSFGATVAGISPGATFTGGSTSYIEIPDHNDFSITTAGSLTLNFFMSVSDWTAGTRDGGAGYADIVGKGLVANYEWTTRHFFDPIGNGPVGGERRIVEYVFSAAAAPATSKFYQDVTLATGTEVMITMVCSSTSLTMYVNSVLQGTAVLYSAAGTVPANGSAPVRIGTRDLGTFFKGKIRRLAFFGAALTGANISDIYSKRTLVDGQPSGDTPTGVVTATAGTGNASGASSVATLDVVVPSVDASQVGGLAVTHIAGATSAVVTPTGWTLAASQQMDNANFKTYLYTRNGPFAGSTITLSATGAPLARWAATPFLLNGADLPSPIEGSVSTANTLTAPSVTATNSRFLLTIHSARQSVASNTPMTLTPHASETELLEADTTSTSGVVQGSLSVNTVVLGAAGATGAKAATASVATGGAASMSVLLLAEPVAPIQSAVKISTLTDNFSTFDTTKWARTDAANVTVSSNSLSITPTGSNPQALTVTTQPYDLTASKVYARVVPAPGASNATNFFVKSLADSTQDTGFQITSDAFGARTLYMGRRVSAVFQAPGPAHSGASYSMPYSVTDQAFLQIRQDVANSTVYFETAPRKPTGPTDNPWTVQHSTIDPTWATENVQLYLSAGSSVAATGPALFSDLNGSTFTPPAGDGGLIILAADEFSTQNPALWTWTGASVINGRAQVDTGNSDLGVNNNLTSVKSYDARNGVFDVLVIPAIGGTNPVTYIGLKSSTPGTDSMFTITGGTSAVAGYRVGGTYTAATASWTWVPNTRVRIREGTAPANNLATGTAGVTYFDTGEYNPTTLTWVWTNRGAGTSPAYMNSVQIYMGGSNTGGTSSDSIFDAVNGTNTFTPPSAENPQGDPPPVPIEGGAPVLDDFESGSLDTTLWDDNTGTPTVSGGSLKLDAGTPADRISSTTRINLTGTHQNIEVLNPITATGAYGLFRLENDANNALQWRAAGGTLTAQVMVNGNIQGIGSVNANLARFVQIRELGGKIFFEYGSNPTSLSVIGAAAGVPNPFSVTSLKLIIMAGLG